LPPAPLPSYLTYIVFLFLPTLSFLYLSFPPTLHFHFLYYTSSWLLPLPIPTPLPMALVQAMFTAAISTTVLPALKVRGKYVYLWFSLN